MCIMNQKDELLYHISIVSFVVYDLGLYLDTHPLDKNALEYFNHYSRIRNQMITDFSTKYYPLIMDQSEGCKEWRWGMSPLPWEGVCK